ncbi:MAG TPA: aminotransferase class I/II-fold pyridoxal phosphate-dependent enzyme [Gryllotalpicola sp.]
MSILSPLALSVPHSGIREIVNLALSAPQGSVARLEIGEPDARTPEHVVEAAVRAARGWTGYVQSAGIPQLRELAAERVARFYGGPAEAERVVIGQGAVQVLSAVLTATLAPGDEVLIPDPAWPNYLMQATMVGARPVPYPMRASNGFLPDPAEIEALVTPRTKVLVVNSPSNPTGAVMARELAEELVRVCASRGVLVVSDEVYDEIIFDGEHVHLAAIDPDWVVSVFSFSKTYAMTGWRVGYAVLPGWLAETVGKLQEPYLSSLPSVTQAAAMAALTGPQDAVCVNRLRYAARRDAAVAQLADAGLAVLPPAGAFYLMLPLSAGVDSRTAALELVGRGVSTAPGTAFGLEARSFLRVSLASDEETLRCGLDIFLDWHERTNGGVHSIDNN